MKKADAVRWSMEVITEYYKNNISVWLENIDEDVLWYGPAMGQFLHGRDALRQAWTADTNPLTFSMGDIQAEAVSSSSCFVEVMLSYYVTTYFPSGMEHTVYQRLHLTWIERKIRQPDHSTVKVPKILMASITNPYEQHENDTIYPEHYDQKMPSHPLDILSDTRISLHGTDKSWYFLMVSSIRWIESVKDSRHSLLHLADEIIEVTEGIAEIEALCPHSFLHPHVSYLINPYYVKQLRRFMVTMADGTELPVPEKKYTSLKKQLQAQK